jgi:hypothetical protein
VILLEHFVYEFTTQGATQRQVIVPFRPSRFPRGPKASIWTRCHPPISFSRALVLFAVWANTDRLKIIAKTKQNSAAMRHSASATYRPTNVWWNGE